MCAPYKTTTGELLETTTVWYGWLAQVGIVAPFLTVLNLVEAEQARQRSMLLHPSTIGGLLAAQ